MLRVFIMSAPCSNGSTPSLRAPEQFLKARGVSNHVRRLRNGITDQRVVILGRPYLACLPLLSSYGPTKSGGVAVEMNVEADCR